MTSSTLVKPVFPEIPDKDAKELLVELYVTSGRKRGARHTADGTNCPKHRRNWYLKSKGMPTGF